MCLWCEKLKRPCQTNALDFPQQAVVRKRHEDWPTRKVVIQDIHKVATFLWPKSNQLRMLSHSDRDAIHAHVHTLLQSMATGAPDVESRDPELSGADPTPPAKTMNFAEWENVQQPNWEDDEVPHYIEMAVMDSETDVLGWWKINKSFYPNLSKFARSVLCSSS